MDITNERYISLGELEESFNLNNEKKDEEVIDIDETLEDEVDDSDEEPDSELDDDSDIDEDEDPSVEE